MPPAKFHRQTPRTGSEKSTDHKKNGGGSIEERSTSGTVEALIEEIVESQTGELRAELDALEADIEELDNFARISLNQRRVEQNEAKLTEFSASMTAFAEKAFNQINALEDRLDRQALVLEAIVDELDDDLDLSAVNRYEDDRLVADASPDERLTRAIREAGDD